MRCHVGQQQQPQHDKLQISNTQACFPQQELITVADTDTEGCLVNGCVGRWVDGLVMSRGQVGEWKGGSMGGRSGFIGG